MKKIKRLFCVLLGVVIATSASACSIFSNQPNKTGSNQSGTSNNEEKTPPKTQEITVYDGNVPTTYTATYGQVAEIDTFSRSGYYFTGAYDAPEGGIKYFDGSGQSTMIWGAGKPDTFYTRYDSIYNISYTKIQYDEKPYSWLGTVEKFVEYEFSDELKNAISANLETTVLISGSIDFSCDKSWEFQTVNLKTLKSGGETYSLGKNVLLSSGTYRTFPYSVKVPTRLLQSGKVYISLRALEVNIINARYYYKNVKLSVSFVKSS